MWLPQWHSSKESACNAGDLSLIPGWERSLEKGMATHSSILAWRIPWTEEPGRLQRVAWGGKESSTTELLTLSLSHFCTGLSYSTHQSGLFLHFPSPCKIVKGKIKITSWVYVLWVKITSQLKFQFEFQVSLCFLLISFCFHSLIAAYPKHHKLHIFDQF